MTIQVGRRSLTELLRTEARKRPEIAALIENIDNISNEEIMATKVPLPWFRKALIELKKESITKYFHERAMRMIADQVEEVYVEDGVGSLRRWNGGKTFVALDRGHLEINPNTLLWFPLTGGVWIDTVFAKEIDTQLQTTQFIKQISKSGYAEEVKQQREKNLNGAGTILDSMPQDKPLFTIHRLA